MIKGAPTEAARSVVGSPGEVQESVPVNSCVTVLPSEVPGQFGISSGFVSMLSSSTVYNIVGAADLVRFL